MASSKRIEALEAVARKLVGDGKSPNVFFVSLDGNIIMIALDFHLAYQKWKEISSQRTTETCLEDRQTGVLASIEPGSDEPGAKLVRWDDTGDMDARATGSAYRS
jgi:hypothetical protein